MALQKMSKDLFESQLKFLLEAQKKCDPEYSFTYADVCEMKKEEWKKFIVHLHASVFGRGEQERDLVEKKLIPPNFSKQFYPLYKMYVLDQ